MSRQPNRPSKVLRAIAVTLMGVAVAFTLLGGAGTTCVALSPTKWDSMAALAPYQPLYITIVIVSLITGIIGIRVIVTLVRGGQNAYRNALLVLLVGALSSGVQVAVSQAVRGSSAPQNIRFYITILTLIVFLLLRLPPLWSKTDFTRPAGGDGSAGAASAGTAIVLTGIITLTTPIWTGSTHIGADGANWVKLYHTPLMLVGWGLTLTGASLLVWALLSPLRTQAESRLQFAILRFLPYFIQNTTIR